MVFITSGCWNYREVEDLAVVSGMAFDKNDDKFFVTSEIINVTGGRDSKISTKLITSEGITIFDALRKTIKTAGKRLYFSHAEVIIIGTEVAKEGVIPVMDWVRRDAEPRDTLHFLVSKEKSAKEILQHQPITSDVLSFELNDMLKSEKSLSYAIDTAEWQFIKDLAAMGVSATLPTVDLTMDDNKLVPEITGTGVFKQDRLVGFFNGEETKTMLFIKDKIKGGLLDKKEYKDNSETSVALEIFKNKTKLKPHFANGKTTIEINTNTDVAIGENGGRDNCIDEPARTKLKTDFEAMLEINIKNLVKKAQEQYDTDIFGFGKLIKLNMPDLWKQIESDWDKLYKSVDVDVHSTINIKNSASKSKPIKVGD
jgi:spore germination protein KC